MEVVESLVRRLYERVLATGALQKDQEFTLSSGKKSRYYFDGKLLTLDPEAIDAIGKLMFKLIEVSNVKSVGGLTMGADPIVASIVGESYVSGKQLPGFIVREKTKTHGTMKYIEGHLPVDGDKTVAIVDDVITLGGSINKAIDAVNER